MDEFKRVGGLIWRGLFGALFSWLFLTRLADLVIPSARAGWVSYCATQSIPYLQVLVAQVASVVLSGWMIWIHLDRDQFKSASMKMEYHGVWSASNFFTWRLYSGRSRFEDGETLLRAYEKFNVQFWLAVIVLAMSLGMNPLIEFIFREKKVKEA